MAAPFQSGPIQLLPAGLLGLLQLKSPAGRNPEVLEGNVQPTIDLLEQYLLQASEVWNINSSVALPTGQGARRFSPNSMIVPQSEYWYVHRYTIWTATLAAGDTVTGVLPAIYETPVGAVRVVILPSWNQRGGAATTGQQSVNGAGGFWARPGSELGFWLEGLVAAATVTFNADMLFTRLRI